MLRFKTLPALTGVFLAALLAADSADGSIVQALDLEDLVSQSDEIVLGRVVFSETIVHSNGMLGTAHRVQVEQGLHGRGADQGEVIVETLGGQMGDIGMRVAGEPSFSVGERVVLFGRGRNPDGVLRPVGMGQGVMRVRTEEGVETVRQTREGMMLMRRNSKGRLEQSAGALPTKERLDTFLSRVRVIVEQNAGGANE